MIDVGYAGVDRRAADRRAAGAVRALPDRDDGAEAVRRRRRARATSDLRIQTNGRCEYAEPARRHLRTGQLPRVPARLRRSSAGAGSGRRPACGALHGDRLGSDLPARARARRAALRRAAARRRRSPSPGSRIRSRSTSSSSNTNDAILPALLIWGFWLVVVALGARAFVALVGLGEVRALHRGAALARPTRTSGAARTASRFAAGFAARDASPRSRCCCSSRTSSTRRARLLGAHGRLAARPRVAVLALGLGAVPRGASPTCTSSSSCSRSLLVVGAVARRVRAAPEVAAPARGAHRRAARRLRARADPLVLPLHAVVLPLRRVRAARRRAGRGGGVARRRRSTRVIASPGARPGRLTAPSRPSRPPRSAWSSSASRGRCCTTASTTRDQIVDTPVYERYGDAMADGEVPYRDFRLEYPPARAAGLRRSRRRRRPRPSTSVQRRVRVRSWPRAAAALVLAVALTLARAGRAPWRVGAALGFVALAPLALGSRRPDALRPLAGRARRPAPSPRSSPAATGSARPCSALAVAAKLYPARARCRSRSSGRWRRRGRARPPRRLGVFAAARRARFVPVPRRSAPAGSRTASWRQLSRPLQIESLGSALAARRDRLDGTRPDAWSGHGSQNIAGGRRRRRWRARDRRPGGRRSSALWIAFARGPADRSGSSATPPPPSSRSSRFGKVLSPQFLSGWSRSCPLVAGAARARRVGAARSSALVLTQLWFPFRYWDFALTFDEPMAWLVLARDLVLVALAGRARRGRSGDGHAERLAARRAAVGVALDERALDPHVARRRARSAPAGPSDAADRDLGDGRR